jgi:AcrR family transcriptional regulator
MRISSPPPFPDRPADAGHPAPPQIADGRRRRGAANRNRISQAFLAMAAEGKLTPTAEQVANRAGVGLRSVFRHFTDMEMLYREVAAHTERLARGLSNPVRRDQGWESALDALIEARADIYEQIMPFQLATRVHQHDSAYLRAHQEAFADLQRTTLFNALPKVLLRDKPTLEAVNVALSFDTWTRLRREQRLNREASKRVMALTCAALLRRAGDQAAD